MRVIRNMVLGLLAAILAGTALMIGVYALPTERMRDNFRSSMDIMQSEGGGYSWAAGPIYPPSGMPGLAKNWTFLGHLYSHADGFADEWMLNKAIWRSGLPLYDAMLVPSGDQPDVALPREELIKALQASNYARYWHGYLLFLKPLLMMTNLAGIRVLNMWLQFLLIAAVLFKTFEKLGKGYAWAFVLTLLFINPISSVVCLQFCDVYYITLIVALLMLSRNDQLENEGGYPFLFMMTGIATAFFDFLTYPLVTLGLPLTLYLLLNGGGMKVRITSMVKLTLSWGFGYAGMWSGKWVMASLLTGYDALSDAAKQVALRLNGDAVGGDLQAWLAMRWPLMRTPLLIALLGMAAFTALCVWAVKNGRVKAAELLSFALIGCYPFLWYGVVRNHSIMHYFFTYKVLSITVFAALCILIKCLPQGAPKEGAQ